MKNNLQNMEEASVSNPEPFNKATILRQLEELKDSPLDESMEEIHTTRLWNKAISQCIDIVKKNFPIDWVPVTSEQYPPDEEIVDVTLKKDSLTYYAMAYRDEGFWYWANMGYKISNDWSVIAWRPWIESIPYQE